MSTYSEKLLTCLSNFFLFFQKISNKKSRFTAGLLEKENGEKCINKWWSKGVWSSELLGVEPGQDFWPRDPPFDHDMNVTGRRTMHQTSTAPRVPFRATMHSACPGHVATLPRFQVTYSPTQEKGLPYKRTSVRKQPTENKKIVCASLLSHSLIISPRF